ncbi:MAG: ferric uptake regulation protein [Elusimicrobia bacterium GWA2_61_42]|nr:MAG: ferric uptake regulation protein [Elusimicrobia bacterium GWA2_61_42]OGR77938.1 MAG: ferric uptake regulation protein [Elusimicrobia bacterium GWC2_61_25]
MSPHKEHNPNCCCRRIRGHGRRMTPARHAVLDALSERGEHLTAEEVFRSAARRYPNLGLATVYRTLELLTELGMVSRFDTGDDKARYEFADPTGAKGHHHHLVCTSCRKIIDYKDFIKEETELLRSTEEGLSRKYGFKINSHVIQFYGVCRECGG